MLHSPHCSPCPTCTGSRTTREGKRFSAHAFPLRGAAALPHGDNLRIMSELSWVELMGRHAASAALYVSGAMNYLDAEGQRQQTRHRR